MDAPNVVILVFDAVRADRTSVYGHGWPTTPNLEALAEDGVVYEHAFANSNWTGTSHGALFTGRLPSDTGVHGNAQELPTDVETLPELLSEAGYRTFAMSAGAHLRAERGYARGMDTFGETFRIAPNREFFRGLLSDQALLRQTLQSVTRGPDEKSLYKVESLKQWIEGGDRPFFAFVNAKTAHHPYNPPRPFKSEFCPNLRRAPFQLIEELFGDERGERQSLPGFDWDRLQRLSYEYPVIAGEMEPTDEEWEIVRSWYDGAIRYLDHLLGDFVDWLEGTGRLENTYIFVTADHGEYFGEHGLEKHYYGLYEPVLHVPLVVRGPGTDEAADTVSSPVSLADLYPTVLELATGEAPMTPHSRTLAPFKDGNLHEHVFAELGAVAPDGILRHHPEFDDRDYGIPTQVVRDDRYKLISRANGSTELYDWREDPGEREEISEDKADVHEQLAAVVEEELEELSEESLSEDIDDEQLRRHLEELGYI